MADIAKAHANVRRIIEGGGTERDVNEYLSMVGVKASQLRAYGAAQKRTDTASRLANSWTGGLADKLVAAGQAGIGEIKERLGTEPARSFGERYSEQRDAIDAANAVYSDENPIRSGAATVSGLFMGRPAATGMSVINAARTSGAVGGGLTGLGQSEGKTPLELARDTAIGVLVGFGLGDVAARFLPRAVDATARTVAPVVAKLRPTPSGSRAAGQEVAAAAQRQNIRVLPADVGGPATRRVTAAMVQTPLGAGPIVKAAEESVGDMADAAGRAATSAGPVSDSVSAGEAVRRGAKGFMDATEKRGGALYEAIPISSAVDGQLANTRAALAELTSGFASNPKLSAMFQNGRLKGYLEALTPDIVPTSKLVVGGGPTAAKLKEVGGKLSWGDLKRFRSIVGELAGEARFSDDTTRAQMQRLYGALSEDMRSTAAGQGPRALKAFERANNYWRGREKRIDDTLAAILGETKDKGAQTVFEGIERLTNAKGGDPIKLARAIRSLSADEVSTVRATIIDRLGRASAGQQNAAGDVFSPATFLTNWNKMSPRAKGVLFNDPELRSSLDDIARVAQGTKEAQRFANASQTGGVVGTLGTGVALPGLYFEPVLTTLGIAGNVATGKLMASPAFAKWLARAPKVAAPKGGTIADGIRGHVAQLSAVAARDPAIRNEVIALQQRLTDAFSSGGWRAAAEEEPGDAVGMKEQDGGKGQPE